ncbi:MAG: hypothetical protein ACT4P1_00900 [Sporichthyaceae bacterium]
MTRIGAALALVLAVGLTAGCGDGEAATPAPVPGAPATVPVAPDSGPGPGQDTPTDSGPSDGAPSAGLTSVLQDVGKLAPALESFYRGKNYPRTLKTVVASLADANVDLAPGNRIAAYRYDPAAVEFELCIQNEDGAFASYDTAPMSPVRQGESGGCPQL